MTTTVKHPALREIVEGSLGLFREACQGVADVQQANAAARQAHNVIRGVSVDLEVRLAARRVLDVERHVAAALAAPEEAR